MLSRSIGGYISDCMAATVTTGSDKSARPRRVAHQSGADEAGEGDVLGIAPGYGSSVATVRPSSLARAASLSSKVAIAALCCCAV